MGSRREGAWLPVVGSYWGDDTTDFGFCQLLAATMSFELEKVNHLRLKGEPFSVEK